MKMKTIGFAAVAVTFVGAAMLQAQPETIRTACQMEVASNDHNAIVKVNSTGNQTVFTSGGNLNGPAGLAFDSSGNLYVANANNNAIVKVDSSGNQSVLISGGEIS